MVYPTLLDIELRNRYQRTQNTRYNPAHQQHLAREFNKPSRPTDTILRQLRFF